MGIFDDIILEVEGEEGVKKYNPYSNNTNIFDDVIAEVEAEELERQRQANRGIIPMGKRAGQYFVQGIKNVPSALVGFVKDSYNAGKKELELAKQGEYNPVEAVSSSGLGMLQGGANLLEGIWNAPGDIRNLYEGQELTKPTHPLTQGLPNLLNKTQFGQNYLDNVALLQEKYPLANTLSQELGEELPGMIAGVGLAGKLGKVGKLGKATDIKTVGYGDLAKGSVVGGLGEGLLIDPSSNGEYLTPEQRWTNRFANAGTGAVIAPTLNVATKATLQGVDTVAPHVQQGVNYAKEVTGEIIKNGGNGAKFVADEIVNRLNPNNYEQTIEMVPQETGVGLSQRTEYVPQVKRVYKNPNATPSETININAQPINPQPQSLDVPLITDNGTGFVLGESGDLVQKIAPNIYKKQQSKGTSKPIMALSDNLDTNVAESISKIAPKTVEKQEEIQVGDKINKSKKQSSKETKEEKEAKEMAWGLLARVTGKDVKYLKATLNNKSKSISKQKQAEKLYDLLLDKADDKLDIISPDPSLKKYFVWDDELGAERTKTLVEQALKIINSNFGGFNTEKYTDYLNEEGEYYEKLVNEVKEKLRNAKNEEELWEIYDNIENVLPVKIKEIESIYSNCLDILLEQQERLLKDEQREIHQETKTNPQEKSTNNVRKVERNVSGSNRNSTSKKSNKEKIEEYINSKPTIEEVENYLGKENAQKSKLVEKLAPNIAKKQGLTSENVDKTTETGNNIRREEEENETRQESTRSELGDNSINNERTEGTRQESDERVQREQSRDGSSNARERLENVNLIPEHKSLIEQKYKNAHELNVAIENFIKNKEYKKYDVLPEEIKVWLKKYTGAGGKEKQGATGKGLLSEYYTPKNIVKKMWDITSQYINTDGAKVLEPSVGIGRFLEFAPENINADVVEMNPVSAKITELLYPQATVTVGQFEEKFIKNNAPVKSVTPEYDIVIGNPPYGAYSGKYKGMGEGKGIERIETYFISRSLDTLKENGIMTFIIPSSFLDGAISSIKLQIGQKAELLDAYRLPENTFDTTSIGTDIIVLRKTKAKQSDKNLSLGKWFKEHPEKVLGETLERKGRFGKQETYVKGDKSAVENIDTSKKDVKETKKTVETTPKSDVKKTTNKTSKKKTETKKVKGKVEYNEYKPLLTVPDEEMKYFADTRVDGTLPKDKYSPSDKVNQYNGELYNDFNYLQGDIYEKLDSLNYENISEKQKEIQRKKLKSVLPTPKTVKEISFTPTSDFVKGFIVGEDTHWDWQTRQDVKTPRTIVTDFQKYLRNLGREERENVSVKEIISYTNGEAVRFDYNYPPNMYDKKEREKFAKQQRPKLFAKLKRVSEKLFNNYISEKLDTEYQEQLAEFWNRAYNNLYTPDYYKMPLLVNGLRDTFYGKKLELNKLQEKGINFLTNKGIGLLGFEVGTGKTLSGIISTVQNMQMGRCKRPLILVPKQVKDNWIAELNETFPNITVNDVGNLSNFKGEIEDNTVTVATYEALSNIWYEPELIEQMKNDLFDVTRRTLKEGEKRTARKIETDIQKAEELIGKAQKNNKELFKLSELGFDHITVDEAHNFKNLFNKAETDGKEDGTSKGNSYGGIQVQGGDSQRASRLFLLVQQILKNNDNRNVFMLTATPFSNNPLEVFNMLSYLSKDSLDKVGLYNAYQFMEHYADTDADWVVNINNDVVMKNLVKGFKNSNSLRKIINNVILMGTADEVGIKRPEKFTNSIQLEPSKKQLELIREAEEELMENKTENGAIFKALHKSRMATLSPDIASGNLTVSPEEFIKNSPKLQYIMEAVESMKKKDPKTSQLIYMPMGVAYLPKIKKYLVDKGVFKADEIEVITSEVKDDKIPDITKSFNDRDGKIKLIIGTQKIKEGMNLNKNSSVLYIPQLDWNPTDFVQVVGRIWRQGNRYNKVRVVVPLLKNSSDPFMYQKLSEKTSRLNDLMSDEAGDYIDSGELNTEEERLNMITLPDKKAKMFTVVESEKINGEISELKGKLDTVQRIQSELKQSKGLFEYNTKEYERYTELLKDVDKETEEYRYNSLKKYREQAKKDLVKYKGQVERLEKTIKDREFDFEGKDKPENIEAEINKLEERKENLKEIELQKLEEYTKEYNKNQVLSKSIAEQIKDFDNQTDELYGGVYPEDSSIDIPEAWQTNNNTNGTEDLDLNSINQLIEDGTTVNELMNYLPYNVNYFVRNFADYKVVDMSNEVEYSVKGKHSKTTKTIKLNLKAVGNNPYKFIETFIHEIEHADQTEYYKKILAKLGNGEELTPREKKFKKEFQNSDRRNKVIQRFFNLYSTKSTMKKYNKKTKGMNEKESLEYLQKMSDTEIKTVLKYRKYFNAYMNLFKEEPARKLGEDYAKEFKNETRIVRTNRKNEKRPKGTRDTSNFTLWSKKWDSRTDNRLGVRGRGLDLEDDFSVEIQSNTDEIDYSKYNKVVKNYIREWYSDIEKDRYDVNKTLNSFINMTKAIAKEYSNKFGMKINDKQVREILPFLRERTELPENLERTDLKEFFDKLSGQDKERLTKLADDTSKKFEKYYAEYQEAKGVEDIVSIENHISHIWDLDKKQRSLLTNYFTTSSRFAKNRTIDTLVKGIEGFEINGETIYFKPKTLDYAEILKISSDSFIKAKSDMILADRVKILGIRKGRKINNLVLPTSKAPSDWIEFNHPALNKSVYMGGNEDVTIVGKSPVKVHPEIAKALKTVFETPATRNAFFYHFDRLNALYKQSQLGFSGFHMVALSESMLGNIGVKETVKLLNPKRIYEEVAKGNWRIYKDDTIAKQAIEDGLQLGATLDLDRGTVEKLADDVTEYVGKLPVVGKYLKYIPKTLGKAQRLNNQILWDYLHNNYKLECYKLFATQQAEKLGRKLTTPERREIAQWVNDSFGGQVWENLGISSSQRRIEQRLLLSPDWLRSTTRQFLAMFSTEKGSKFLNEKAKENDFWKQAKDIAEEWGINSNTEDIGASNLRGRLSRAFWLRALIYSAILYNMMNAFFREKDRQEYPQYYPKNMTIKDYSLVGNSKGSKTFVFIGRNSDGTERYLRLGKQFREMPEMIEKPLEKLGGKASPLVQIGSQILTGNTASGFKNRNFYDKKGNLKKGWERVGESAKLLGTSFAPFSMNSLFNPYMDTTAWSLFAPVGKGMTRGKGTSAFIEAYKKGNKEEIQEIRQSLVRNGFNQKDIKKIESTSKSQFIKPYKDRYVEALEEKDKEEVLKIKKELSKTGLSSVDRQKIYKKALKEYLK